MIEFMKEGGFKAPEPADLNGHAIIGLGSAGVNILDQILLENRSAQNLFCFDTDEQGIRGSVVSEKILMGCRRIRGLGTGGDPGLAAEIARDEHSEIRDVLQGTRTAVLAVGLGGGTGSGMALEFVRILKQLGASVLVVAVTPFDFEGKRRLGQALEAVTALKAEAEVVLCFSNSRLLNMPDNGGDIRQGFSSMNSMVGKTCMSLRTMLCQRSPMQIHLSDLKNLVSEHDCGSPSMENCWTGFGTANGEERVREVVNEVLSSPLFEDGQVWKMGAAVVACLGGGEEMSMGEFQQVIEYLKQEMPVELPVLAGTMLDANAGDDLHLTLLVTGQSYEEMDQSPKKKASQEFTFDEKPALSEAVQPQIQPVVREKPPVAAPVTKHRPEPIPQPEPVATDGPGFDHWEDGNVEAVAATEQQQKYFIQQDELPLEKKTYRGRFEKSAPTVFNGQDLDQPTYLRLNLKIRL